MFLTKEIFIGLEDSKRSWKLCVRSDKVIVHETSMPAKYENLRNYFRNKFPDCEITVMYEAGFEVLVCMTSWYATDGNVS